jgi:hypothetical protein
VSSKQWFRRKTSVIGWAVKNVAVIQIKKFRKNIYLLNVVIGKMAKNKNYSFF